MSATLGSLPAGCNAGGAERLFGGLRALFAGLCVGGIHVAERFRHP